MLNFFRNIFKKKEPEKSRIDRIEERYLAVFESATPVAPPTAKIGSDEEFPQANWEVISVSDETVLVDASELKSLLESGSIPTYREDEVEDNNEKDPL